jgi:hypothetical protein
MAVDVGGRHQRRLFVKQILALCNRSVISHEKLRGDVKKTEKPPEKLFRQDRIYCCVYYGLRILPQKGVNKKAPKLNKFYLLNFAYVMKLQTNGNAIFNGELNSHFKLNIK